jgi:Na+-transporting NADH:ubiquinone oxidoreductase subunit NqrB
MNTTTITGGMTPGATSATATSTGTTSTTEVPPGTRRGTIRSGSRWFARLLDRVSGISMYRLLLAVLGALAGWALALAAFGALPFTPLDLFVTLAVLVTSTWASGAAYARLFGARAHAESSLITAALIAFVVWPSTDPLALAAFALAGIAASASKFLLVARGRHLLNPAAFGVLFVTVLQLTGGVWWVATPAMLPLVVLGAALVWYRSGTAAVGGTVVLVGGMLLVVARLLAATAQWPRSDTPCSPLRSSSSPPSWRASR